MAVIQHSVYDDIAEFLASLSPEKVLAYHPSEKNQKRLSALLAKKQAGQLTASEAEELEHFFTVERIIRIAKAHALYLQANEQVHS